MFHADGVTKAAYGVRGIHHQRTPASINKLPLGVNVTKTRKAENDGGVAIQHGDAFFEVSRRDDVIISEPHEKFGGRQLEDAVEILNSNNILIIAMVFEPCVRW